MSLRIIEWAKLLSPLSKKIPYPSAMTIGFFDGVHRGHVELITRVVQQGMKSTIVTFRENPKKFFEHHHYPGDIFSLEQKLSAFRILGIEQVILIDFSESFSKMKGKEFISILIDRGNLRFLAIGSSFRCGHKLDIDAGIIKDMNEAQGIPTEVVPSLRDDIGSISSSRIRSAIIQGDLPMAAALLGRNIELELSSSNCNTFNNGAGTKEKGITFNMSGRLLPPPGQYRALLHRAKLSGCLMEQIWEGDIVLGKGELTIPYLEYDGNVKVEFLSGPAAF